MLKRLLSKELEVQAKLSYDKNKTCREVIKIKAFMGEPCLIAADLPNKVLASKFWSIECFIDGRFWLIEGGDGEVWNTYMEPFPGIDLRSKVFGRK